LTSSLNTPKTLRSITLVDAEELRQVLGFHSTM
jgi:hypothetical protein